MRAPLDAQFLPALEVVECSGVALAAVGDVRVNLCLDQLADAQGAARVHVAAKMDCGHMTPARISSSMVGPPMQQNQSSTRSPRLGRESSTMYSGSCAPSL